MKRKICDNLAYTNKSESIFFFCHHKGVNNVVYKVHRVSGAITRHKKLIEKSNRNKKK